VTWISDFTGANPVKFTLSSGGSDPVAAFVFSSGSGYDDLVVANNGDGALALFTGGPDGLTLFSTTFEPDLPNPTALAFAGVVGDKFEFSGPPEGREAAILVALSLGGQSPLPPPITEPSVTPAGTDVAQLVALDDSSLALVGSLVIVTVETSSGESIAPAP